MIYLISRTVKYTFLGIALAAALAVVAGVAAFVITFVTVIMLMMIADAILESTALGLAALASGSGLRKAGIAFSRRFSTLSTRYSSWGHRSLRRAH